jgi:hypothetical protein
MCSCSISIYRELLVIVIEIVIYWVIDYDYEHRCTEHEHDLRRQLCYL